MGIVYTHDIFLLFNISQTMVCYGMCDRLATELWWHWYSSLSVGCYFCRSSMTIYSMHGAKYIWKYLSKVQVLWNFVKYKYKYSSWNQRYTLVLSSTVKYVLKSTHIWYLTNLSINPSTPAGIKKYLSKIQVLSNVYLKLVNYKYRCTCPMPGL